MRNNGKGGVWNTYMIDKMSDRELLGVVLQDHTKEGTWYISINDKMIMESFK